MILSSVDILRILGGSDIIRLSSSASIVDGRPTFTGAEGLHIFVDRFPVTKEFEATWTLYIESDDSEPDDLVVSEIRRLLPSVKVENGLFTVLTTTDFLSGNTQRAPQAPVAAPSGVKLSDFEERFEELSEDLKDRMLLVSNGRDGGQGADGRDGKDGADGKDSLATDTELFDLQDVDKGIPLSKGQVLMWDGSGWTNLHVPTLSAVLSGGGSGDGGGGIEEAPNDGQAYLRQSEGWVPTTTLPGDGIEEAPNDGQAYLRQSEGWVPTTTLPVDISSNALDDLSDVSATAPAAGEALIYDGTQWAAGGDFVGGNF